MKIISTPLKDLFVFEPQIWDDSRGYFYESFRQDALNEIGFSNDFVQDNESFSKYGTLRGLHFQLSPKTQTKLVRVVQGEVLDVVVDIRPNSITFGQHFKIRLSAENHLQMLVPKGFAHGYVVLSETAKFVYKCDEYYSNDHESGILYNDSTLNIDWECPSSNLKLSEKDLNLPMFSQLEY